MYWLEKYQPVRFLVVRFQFSMADGNVRKWLKLLGANAYHTNKNDIHHSEKVHCVAISTNLHLLPISFRSFSMFLGSLISFKFPKLEAHFLVHSVGTNGAGSS